jgi:hypothetical protein
MILIRYRSGRFSSGSGLQQAISGQLSAAIVAAAGTAASA